MSDLITMEEALTQLRYTADDPSADQTEVQRFIDDAVAYATSYLQRYLYVDQPSLDAAIAAIPDALQAAQDAYDAALAAAAQMPRGLPKDMAIFKAQTDYDAAASVARWTYLGMLMNESIRRALLMLISHYDQNREAVYADVGSVAEIPFGVDNHLTPFRAQMGV
jgi:hypothetical protein